MYRIGNTELRYADRLQDGSVRFISSVNKKFSEIVVQNGTIVKALAGQSHTYYRNCIQKQDEAILYMSENPECLAEFLKVLSSTHPCYEFAKKLLTSKASEIQKDLDKINKILSEIK